MNYNRLTFPNIKPIRCKETNYTQQEELEVLRQRLYELENKIEDGLLVEVPGIIPIQLHVYEGPDSFHLQPAYQVIWYDEYNSLVSQIEINLDTAQELLAEKQEILVRYDYND